MKIFVLEDCNSKFQKVEQVINNRAWLERPIITRAEDFSFAQRALEREVYDLLILDLMVPIRASGDPEDLTADITSLRLDDACKNRSTPAVALTQFEDKADERIRELNRLGITVVTYGVNIEWEAAINRAIEHNEPPVHYDFAIVCALRKERDAYDCLSDIGEEVIIEDLSCKPVKIGGLTGVIVVPTRMGLVSSAIACTKVIERFKPKLLAMSGICAGFESSANIYDIVIPERCYQHDSGKWTEHSFVLEPYQVALDPPVRLKIDRLINKKGFGDSLLQDVKFGRNEIPEDLENPTCSAKLAVASSGSSVVASNTVSEQMKLYHRKGVAFEMESYALYESAVSSIHKPMYFSAKCVVDNGNVAKSDHFHRNACILSAKACMKIIEDLLA